MAYTVLARKYRSRTFSEVVGQAPIATTLENAITSDRIHHGYLFTGTRGVGKTSMARILAKALNCLNFDKATATPCMECDACKAISEGNDIDVVEIDAASNTGVDNIRELRSNAAYRPARSRYKIYIIDEVHMLSTGAFNALLKTLEEPPEHVKFILATTEIQKVPATIQSRCQRFNFRNIGPDEIANRLAEIITTEGAVSEEVVVRRIARLANGSMRDALSILDQLLSVSPTKLDVAILEEILPPAQDERVFAVLQKAAASDVNGVLMGIDGILSKGRGMELLCADTIEVVRALMLLRACGPDAPMVDIPAGEKDAYVQLCQQFELSQYVQMIAMLEELRRSVRHSGAGRALMDAAMVRLANMKQWASVEQLISRLNGVEVGGDEKKKSLPVADVAMPATVAAAAPKPVSASQPIRNASAPAKPMPTGANPPRNNGNMTREAVSSAKSTAVAAVAESEESESAAEQPKIGTASVSMVSVSKDEQKRIRQDPVVKQVMELFDGAIVNMVKRSGPSTADEEAE